jgi:hypothetical protein
MIMKRFLRITLLAIHCTGSILPFNHFLRTYGSPSGCTKILTGICGAGLIVHACLKKNEDAENESDSKKEKRNQILGGFALIACSLCIKNRTPLMPGDRALQQKLCSDAAQARLKKQLNRGIPKTRR